MRFFLTSAAALFVASIAITPADAAPTYSGTVGGTFSSPVFAGNLIDVTGASVGYDNTTTAPPYAIISPNGDTLSWGTSTTGANPPFSYLTFYGASFANVAANTPFLLGQIQYQNGTSDLSTLIFGGALTLNLGLGIDPKIITFGVLTTANTGLSAARDADFISFSGDFPLTFNVYENGLARADLYGQIVGDPYVVLTDLKIADGYSGAGFIGTGVGAVPEASTWAMMLAGLGGLGLMARRRRRVIAAA